MARSAVGGASVTVAPASARPQSQGSSMVHAASVTTGSVPHLMGKRAMVRTMTFFSHTKQSQMSQMSQGTLYNESLESTWLYMFYDMDMLVISHAAVFHCELTSEKQYNVKDLCTWTRTFVELNETKHF